MQLEPGDVVVANKGISKVLAVGEVVEPGYEWAQEREEFNHVVRVNWDTSYEQEILAQKSWAFVTVATVPNTLYAQIVQTVGGKIKQIPVGETYKEVAETLERKKQAILYGPPGTGKTYTALRFAVWWLLRELGEEVPPAIFSDKKAFDEAEKRLSQGQRSGRVWWVVANPKHWNWDTLFSKGSEQFEFGRIQKNYAQVQKNDLVIGYQATPDLKIVAIAKIAKGLYENDLGEPAIDLEPVVKVKNGLSYKELSEDTTLADAEPLRHRNQGTLFSLTRRESEYLITLLIERNPDIQDKVDIEEEPGHLTRLTFHPSYSYEDFIEGYRPVDTGGERLVLALEDGILKRICRQAQANPKQPYLILIDEINRANIAKVFGELITLLENDKRGLAVTLPQSKERFSIPENVFFLGTMNTADRSIKLLDTALRRRFGFIELMPDSSLLGGANINNLVLDDFLDELNRRIAEREGREKQIGHSYLMDRGEAISTPEDFAQRFRQDILPLLQEYCYDSYAELASYVGEELVDQEAQKLDTEKLRDPDALIEALAREFARPGEAE